MINIEARTNEEEVLAITRKQTKLYPDPTKEKERLEEAQAEIEKGMQTEKSQTEKGDTAGTSMRNCAEQNIIRRILQTEVPVKLNDLILTVPQLRTTLTNMTPAAKLLEEPKKEKESGTSATDPMLLALTSGRYPTVVEMGILGTILLDTIVDRCSGVNVLPEDTWKKLRQPTLWPPTFQLLTTDQYGIKPQRILMAQPVTIGT